LLTNMVDYGEGKIYHVSAWYDNESSYVNQMVKTTIYFANLK
jgi:glyceraldehyde 3-phosphate dehydrogenase